MRATKVIVHVRCTVPSEMTKLEQVSCPVSQRTGIPPETSDDESGRALDDLWSSRHR